MVTLAQESNQTCPNIIGRYTIFAHNVRTFLIALYTRNIRDFNYLFSHTLNNPATQDIILQMSFINFHVLLLSYSISTMPEKRLPGSNQNWYPTIFTRGIFWEPFANKKACCQWDSNQGSLAWESSALTTQPPWHVIKMGS